MKTLHEISNQYECLIIGGGIVGAGLFRDLGLNNVQTLIVDKGDFSSQTSQASSKMLHGGIRYLENMDFKLVFEALEEKNLWIKIAPHICKEMPFHLPVYSDSKRPLWMIHAGLFLYDALSQFRNSKFKVLRPKEVEKRVPGINTSKLKGSGLYYDAIMDDAKLTLEVILDGVSPTNHALNYTEALSIKRNKNHSTTVTLRDVLTNETKEVTAKHLIYALGPFTDSFLKTIPDYKWKDVLLPSKGSHIWVSKKDLPINEALVMTPHDEQGDRVIFIVPHEHRVLVGTTEVKASGDFFHQTASEEEIDYLLKNLNLYFPNSGIDRSKILASFAGIRPLVKEDAHSDNRGKTSREHKIYHPSLNTYVIAGGKYTTFRVMGQEITKDITAKLHRPYNSDKTHSALKYQSVVNSFDWKLPNKEELKTILEKELVKTFQDLVLRRLSVPSRKAWSELTDKDFDSYFMESSDLLNQYLKISTEELKKSLHSFK